MQPISSNDEISIATQNFKCWLFGMFLMVFFRFPVYRHVVE